MKWLLMFWYVWTTAMVGVLAWAIYQGSQFWPMTAFVTVPLCVTMTLWTRRRV